VLVAVAVAAAAMLGLLGSATSASAGLRNDLQRFSNCPFETFGVSKCLYSVTSSGEFVLGKAKVPITVPVIIQGGLNGSGEVIPAAKGETVSKSAEQVPGGLLGLEVFGDLTEVFAIAELAGTASIVNEVVLPLKVRLANPVLGPNCYLGSNPNPVALHLQFGSLEETFKHHQIFVLNVTLEDHKFAAPGASGCTLLPLIGDATVDLKEGLPSPSGNAAVLIGTTEEVSRRLVKEVLPLPDFGHCVKLPGEVVGKKLVFKGLYTDAGCVKTSAAVEGHFEWVAGPGPKKAFSGTSGPVTLESTSAHTSVKCSASTSSGEYTGSKTVGETIALTGCETGPTGHVVSCQSSGAPAGQISSAALTGRLDFIKENEEGVKPEVGLDLQPASSGNLLAFECGGVATSVSGSVIAPITTVNKMSTAFKMTAKQSGGTQAVQAFEESPKDTLSFSTGGGPEAGGLGATITNTNEEPLEIKAEA
jgi:hypothetical protein